MRAHNRRTADAPPPCDFSGNLELITKRREIPPDFSETDRISYLDIAERAKAESCIEYSVLVMGAVSYLKQQ